MHSQLLIAAIAAAIAVVNGAPAQKFHQRDVQFAWGSTKVRGVNLGGWLILEPFITPSIFERYSASDAPVHDEWSICEKLGKEVCYDALKPHWESFVTITDFKKIRDAGFNVVRIPVGYWAFLDVGEPYTPGAAPYLDKAVEWARQTGLKVIIDLHGAPGSQNGFDHSGHRQYPPGWGQNDSIPQTHDVLNIINQRYAAEWMQDVVIAIQPLNEPRVSSLDSEMVKQFYRDSFYNLREVSNTPVMLHDGFLRPDWLNGFLSPSDNNAHGVVIDHHRNQIFDASLVAKSPTEHLTLACNGVNDYAVSDKWTVIGEWSGAMTDCAPNLNGFRAGNRMEGTLGGASWRIGSCDGKSGWVSSWSQDWKDDVRRYIEVQLDAFEASTDGWIFWNFKTEGSAGEWDLFQLLDAGVFPQPLWERRFARYCTNF